MFQELPTVSTVLLSIIGFLAILFAINFTRSLRTHHTPELPTLHGLAIGMVSNFFDTLGVGSFPTSTSYLRLRKVISDDQIPATLNIGHAPAAVAEALIFITVVPVEPTVLAATTAATAVGAWWGAGLVIKLPRKSLQHILGIASLLAAGLLMAVNLQWLPGGGLAYGLTEWRLVVAIISVCILGALMAAGVGFFGPCLIILSFLGMHPLAIFPIMMSAGALQQLISSSRYCKHHNYPAGLTSGMAIGGVIGVIIAAYLVKSLPVVGLRWLVAFVALYTAIDFIRGSRSQVNS